MAHGSVYLIGGGWEAAGFAHTYGPFVEAAGGTIACVLVVDEDADRDAYFARSETALRAVGARNVVPRFVSPKHPLQPSDLAGAEGILVGGGLTPAYHAAIVATAGAAIRDAVTNGLPYAGFSAGAMIAPSRGIIGGWKLQQGESELVICSEDVSEDEDDLAVWDGLGLTDLAIDVHASQYGTITRLMHAVRTGAVSAGFAIDEDTALELAPDGSWTVRGLGSVYHVQPAGGALSVQVLGHGDHLPAG